MGGIEEHVALVVACLGALYQWYKSRQLAAENAKTRAEAEKILAESRKIDSQAEDDKLRVQRELDLNDKKFFLTTMERIIAGLEDERKRDEARIAELEEENKDLKRKLNAGKVHP